MNCLAPTNFLAWMVGQYLEMQLLHGQLTLFLHWYDLHIQHWTQHHPPEWANKTDRVHTWNRNHVQCLQSVDSRGAESFGECFWSWNGEDERQVEMPYTRKSCFSQWDIQQLPRKDSQFPGMCPVHLLEDNVSRRTSRLSLSSAISQSSQ